MNDQMIQIWDGAISFFALMADQADPQPVHERFNSVLQHLSAEDGTLNGEAVLDWVKDFQEFATEDMPKIIDGFKSSSPTRVVVRVLGSNTYRLCEAALREDIATVTIAIRQGTRALLPYSAALDGLFKILTPEQLVKMSTGSDSDLTLLSILVQMDEALGEKVNKWGISLQTAGDVGVELATLRAQDLADLAAQLRDVVSGRTRECVTKLDALLARKISGARDALLYSSDPVAQAANSLLELLDRLLRAAFTDEEVLQWLVKNYPDTAGLTHLPDQTKPEIFKPTKKAQALCLIHGGGEISEPSVMHELAATAVVATRNDLQRIKHADKGGTPEELAALQQHIAAIEGYLMFAVGLVFAAAPAERVDAVRQRLA